jgi:autotransporter-associated beta strand protein
VGSIAGVAGAKVTSGTITAGGVANTEFAGVMSGTTGLIKTGAGTLTLSGTNTNTGVITVNGGTLLSGKAGVITDTSAVTVASGATWNLADFSETAGSIAGAGNITLGSATLTAGGNNTSTDFSGVISGTNGNLVKTGTQNMTLSGANTYTGATTINAGGINASNALSLGSTDGGTTVAAGAMLLLSDAAIGTEALALTGTLANAAGTSSYAGNITLNATASILVNGTQLTLSGVIADGASTFGITKTGTGIAVLSGVNTYDGVSTLSVGTLALSGSGTLGSTTGNTTVGSGTTLDLQGANSGTEAISIAGGTLKASGGVLGSLSTSTIGGTVSMTASSIVDAGAYDSLTINGVISGAFWLDKTGAGTAVLGGANTYTWRTTVNVNGGTLAVANALGLGAVSTGTYGVYVYSGGAVDLQNVAVGAEDMRLYGGSIKASTGTSSYSGAISLRSNGVIDVGAAELTLSGVISESAVYTLTKNGTGTAILSGTNTYTGAATVNAGTLAISNAAGLGTAAAGTTVANGAKLDLRGAVITTGEPITLAWAR